jgi:ribosomal protein S13
MARLAGVDLPREKRMEIALTYIYGIGKTHAKETLAATGVSPDLRARTSRRGPAEAARLHRRALPRRG